MQILRADKGHMADIVPQTAIAIGFSGALDRVEARPDRRITCSVKFHCQPIRVEFAYQVIQDILFDKEQSVTAGVVVAPRHTIRIGPTLLQWLSVGTPSKNNLIQSGETFGRANNNLSAITSWWRLLGYPPPN